MKSWLQGKNRVAADPLARATALFETVLVAGLMVTISTSDGGPGRTAGELKWKHQGPANAECEGERVNIARNGRASTMLSGQRSRCPSGSVQLSSPETPFEILAHETSEKLAIC